MKITSFIFEFCFLILLVDGPRPSDDDLTSLRALILRITKQLILKEKSANDEELQIILNYLMTMHEVSHSFIWEIPVLLKI